MDYYGLLFLYYLKGLSGKSVLRLFFNIEAGGTEQLLPENTSTPTTTPILADIQYPDGLRTDQYFTYRETPTTVSNKARIKTIKGNTLVWNQVAPSMSSSAWVANRCTKTVSGNTFSLVGTNNSSMSFGVYIALANLKLTVNHNYLFMCVVNPNRGTQIRFTFDSDVRYTTITPNRDNVYTRVVSTATEDPVVCYINHPSSITTSDTVTIKNLMIVDLTLLNDSRITNYDSFRTYYPLDYYDNNAGTLLSFNGNGIKTTGKNLFDLSQFASGPITFIDDVLTGTGAQFHSAYGTYASAKKLNNPKGSQITISFDAWTDQNATSSGNGLIFVTYHYDGTHEDAMIPNAINTPTRFTFQRQDIEKIGWSYGTQGANRWHVENFQVEFGTAETSYEPYTSSTLSLPISTYFPNGMKSAGTVYDELTPTKGTTRIGAVDLGSLTWSMASNNRFISTGIASTIKAPSSNTDKANVVCAKYETQTYSGIVDSGLLGVAVNANSPNTGNICIKDTSYNDATAFKTAMNGVYLYYELATPTETPITTEDANEALSLLMGKSVSSNNANQMINIITKGE